LSVKKQPITISQIRTFLSCNHKAKLRYEDQLVPLEPVGALHFGSVVHSALELLHLTGDRSRVEASVFGQFPDDRSRALMALAMIFGYTEHYRESGVKLIQAEQTFRGPIINPATSRPSTKLEFAGKIDAIAEYQGGIWLLERKTARGLRGDYLERLWTDMQITAYVHAARKFLSLDIKGVLYDVMIKCQLKQATGETESEYDERRAKLLERSKTGKTSARRREPEPDEAYAARLERWYREHPEAFHREAMLVSEDRLIAFQHDLWDIHHKILEARLSGIFTQNPSHCFNYNRPCAYYPICRSGGNPNVIDNFYKTEPAHVELHNQLTPLEAF
jgi:hypothetical protein